MSHLRDYKGDKAFDKDALAEWISQTEDLFGKITAIRASAANQATVGAFDRDIPKPATKAKVQLGHLPAPTNESFEGTAYILGQPMDVVIYRA